MFTQPPASLTGLDETGSTIPWCSRRLTVEHPRRKEDR